MRRIFAAAVTASIFLIAPAFGELASRYSVAGINRDDGSTYVGVTTFTPAGQTYRVAYQNPGSGQGSNGYAIEYKDFLALAMKDNDGGGYLEILARVGDILTGVWTRYGDDGKLTGGDIFHQGGNAPVNVNFADATSDDPTGDYAISGTNPDGSTYTGSVKIERWGDCFNVTRKIGDEKTTGTAVAFKGGLVMNISVGDDTPREAFGVLGVFVKEGDGRLGIWAKAGNQKIGAERWVRK